MERHIIIKINRTEKDKPLKIKETLKGLNIE